MHPVIRYSALLFVIAGAMPAAAQTSQTAQPQAPAAETLGIPASEETIAKPVILVNPAVVISATPGGTISDVKTPTSPATPAAPVAAKIPAAPAMPPEVEAAPVTKNTEAPAAVSVVSPITYSTDQIILLPAHPLIDG